MVQRAAGAVGYGGAAAQVPMAMAMQAAPGSNGPPTMMGLMQQMPTGGQVRTAPGSRAAAAVTAAAAAA